MKKTNKKGFTLMEMLIVVAIIAVLVAIAIPAFSGALTKAKEAADVANIRAAYAQAETDLLINETDTVDDPVETYDVTLNYEDNYEFADATGVLTYTPEKLNEGEPYTWTLAGLDLED